MLRSMTGYAATNFNIANQEIVLEIKSVNHRFLDLNFKLAEEFRLLESELRAKLIKKIHRGKIELRIYAKSSHLENIKSLDLNKSLLNQYLAFDQNIRTQSDNIAPINSIELLNIPGILIIPQTDSNLTDKTILSKFDLLVEDLIKAQTREGHTLAVVLQNKLNAIIEITKQITPLINEAYNEYFMRLKTRLMETLNGEELNENRLQQELAYFCQRYDLNEELERLLSHANEILNLIQQKEHPGKQIDFLCQEMHREANTLVSKSISLPITKQAVDLKVLIEQIREQIQNIM